MSILAIIILILILIIMGCGFAGFIYIRNKARTLSRQLWGTESISEGVEQMKREYATTPKSVSAMTSLMLPKITTDFPDFQYDEMKKRAQNVLTSYLRAITENNLGALQDANAELKAKLENYMNMLADRGRREHFDQVRIHRTEISQYRKSQGRCIITFQSACESYHYIEKDGSIVEGEKDLKYQTKYNIDLIYIQNRELVSNEMDHALGINCPNCGAPISNLGAKFCEYCGTGVVELNIHAWSFSDVEEVK